MVAGFSEVPTATTTRQIGHRARFRIRVSNHLQLNPGSSLRAFGVHGCPEKPEHSLLSGGVGAMSSILMVLRQVACEELEAVMNSGG
jgi:hypothetical protein